MRTPCQWVWHKYDIEQWEHQRAKNNKGESNDNFEIQDDILKNTQNKGKQKKFNISGTLSKTSKNNYFCSKNVLNNITFKE